jgi:hypothetical protein
MEKNITARWEVDMKSDSWLSKNVRPMVLIFLVVCTMLMIFIDAGTINFLVEEKWTDLLQIVLITVIGAYFGGRSFEKWVTNYKQGKPLFEQTTGTQGIMASLKHCFGCVYGAFPNFCVSPSAQVG